MLRAFRWDGTGWRRTVQPGLRLEHASDHVSKKVSTIIGLTASLPLGMKVAAFTFETLPSRVVFGPGTLARVPAELERRGWKHALVLVTAGRRAEGERLLGALEGRGVG